VSTILKALEKRRVDRDLDADPEAILERNAAYRLAARRGPSGEGSRWPLLFAVISLVLVLLCVIGTTWVWINAPSRRTEAPGPSEAALPAPTPTPMVTPYPSQLVEQTQTPAIRETVRLRTRPLLRSAPPADVSDVYAAGSHPPPPTTTPPSVSPPQPILIFPGPSGAWQTSGSLPIATSQTARRPGDFLRLTGIILDPKKPTALINDEIVRVGDVIEGVKVLAIDNASSVRVEYQGKQYDLELK
jgi:hypothetical protein